MTDSPEYTSTEIVPAAPRTGAEVAMMDRSTDSWTVVVEDVAYLANRIANTDFVPNDHRGNVGQVAAVILHGRELGLPPMTALASTHVIKGKPSISAEVMRSLILQAGHRIVIAESTSSRCTIRGRRAEVPAPDGVTEAEIWTTVTWTMDDARQAGLLSNNQWKTYPRQMLAARATAELARLIFADVIHGMRAIEEMDDAGPWTGPSTAVEQTAAPATTTVRRKATSGARTASRKAAEPAPAEQQQEHPPAVEQPAPERRRPDLPTRGRRSPETHDTPATPTASEAGEPTPTPVSDPAPSVEDQQAEIRQLSDEKRRLEDQAPAEPDKPADAVDAEVIDTADRRRISPGQRGFLMAQFKRLGVEDREMRLSYSMALTGRDDLESSNQLTFSQASELIKALEGFRDLDALEQQINGQTPLT